MSIQWRMYAQRCWTVVTRDHKEWNSFRHLYKTRTYNVILFYKLRVPFIFSSIFLSFARLIHGVTLFYLFTTTLRVFISGGETVGSCVVSLCRLCFKRHGRTNVVVMGVVAWHSEGPSNASNVRLFTHVYTQAHANRSRRCVSSIIELD